MRVELVYSSEEAKYRFGRSHPMQPERFSLAVELAEAWGLLGAGGAVLVAPEEASEAQLLTAHGSAYVAAVKRASDDPDGWRSGFGIGPGDTPAFPGMHEAAALAVGATARALRDVVSGDCARAFSPAGGLHHAHSDRAAGFCVYNDLAVAIAVVSAQYPGTRVAYVDLDAHHGDGVQEAFWERDDVLTISVNESGAYLYPGTGRATEIGSGTGRGFAMNVPLPPDAGDECFSLVLAEIVGPALEAFSPDVIVAQLGADSHRNDPLTHLDTTVAGQFANASKLVEFAEKLAGGRIVATGGGGYDAYSATPRAWACVLAALLGVEPPAELPRSWRDAAASASGGLSVPPEGTFDELSPAPPAEGAERALLGTQRVIRELQVTHPLLQK